MTVQRLFMDDGAVRVRHDDAFVLRNSAAFGQFARGEPGLLARGIIVGKVETVKLNYDGLQHQSNE